jgi:hypothetical protein
MGKRRNDIMGENMTEEDMTSSANSVKNLRTCAKTKQNYNSMMKHVMEWYQAKHPEYIQDDTLMLPVPTETMKQFYGYLCSAATARENLTGPEQLTDATVIEPYSISYLESHRSAIVDQYKKQKITIEPDMLTEWDSVIEGYGKLLKSLKKKGLYKLKSGKRELRKVGYFLLCDKFMRFTPEGKGGSWSTSIFGWCFFTLLWNLISRPESVEEITLSMITWREDCLCIDEEVMYIVLINYLIIYNLIYLLLLGW